MKTDLKFEALQSLEAELLVVLAADASTSKDKNAAAEPVLLTKDATVAGADKPALKSGEFSATSLRNSTAACAGGTESQAAFDRWLGESCEAFAGGNSQSCGSCGSFCQATQNSPGHVCAAGISRARSGCRCARRRGGSVCGRLRSGHLQVRPQGSLRLSSSPWWRLRPRIRKLSKRHSVKA